MRLTHSWRISCKVHDYDNDNDIEDVRRVRIPTLTLTLIGGRDNEDVRRVRISAENMEPPKSPSGFWALDVEPSLKPKLKPKPNPDRQALGHSIAHPGRKGGGEASQRSLKVGAYSTGKPSMGSGSPHI